ncbi:MAG: FAD:protein FMN transferase [Crocinitomicaceae bacterium]
MKYIIFALPLFLMACGGSTNNQVENNEQETSSTIEFFGNTQGTTFSVFVNDPINLELEEIETTLHNFDLALSTYIPNSIVSHLNDTKSNVFMYRDSFGYFNRCYLLSQEVYRVTEGAFDPTVYPLIDGWGFLKDRSHRPDSAAVDSLRSLIGFTAGYHFNPIQVSDTAVASTIIKNTPNAKLDFNAIAQGIAVDVLAELIESKGGKNYFVEIGGEIRVNGKNKDGNFWNIGIDKPVENSSANDRVIYEIVSIDNRSIATSGSYRKFYEEDGIKYSHTINPKTGYPVTHTLLSATVVADNCGLADAMATAMMVMGPDKGMDFVKAHPELNIEVYLMFNNAKHRLETYYTEGFKEMIVED